jgi:hypothetical protein
MPILFLPLLAFLIFVVAAGWGFNALSHRLGSDVAIAIYFLALALLSAGPIAWWRARQRRIAREAGTLADRSFLGAHASIVVDPRKRIVTLTLQGVTEHYPLASLRQWSIFERTLGAPVVGVEIRTTDVAHAQWSLPLSNLEQARDCVRLLNELKGPGTKAAFSAESE